MATAPSNGTDWLSWIQGITAVLNVGAAIFLLRATNRYVELTGKLSAASERSIDLTKDLVRISKAQIEPQIEVFLSPHESLSQHLVIAVSNVGKGFARDVKFELNEDISLGFDSEQKLSENNFLKSVQQLASGQTFEIALGSFGKLKSANSKSNCIKITVRYRGTEEERMQAFELRLDSLEGVLLTTPPIYRISDSVLRICQSTNGIAASLKEIASKNG